MINKSADTGYTGGLTDDKAYSLTLMLEKAREYMLLDYHIHSQADDNFSPLHRKLDILRQYVEYAQNRCVQEIGISDHCYRFAEFAPILGHLAKAPDAYPDIKAFIGRSFIDHLDEHVAFFNGQNQRLPIKIGLEVD